MSTRNWDRVMLATMALAMAYLTVRAFVPFAHEVLRPWW